MMYSSTTDGMSPGREGVEIERRLDWNANRVLILHLAIARSGQ